MKPKRLNSVIIIVYLISMVLGYAGSIASGESSSNTMSYVNANSHPIANNNDSIQYHLYTPDHPKEVCYFEPDVSNACIFNSSYETKVMIHGYTVKLLPGNYFEQIKDTLMEYNKYNIIIVNWTQYNGEPYTSSVERAHPVAKNIGNMLNFLVSNKGVNPLDVHIIGHSLGAHIAGVAGMEVHNLGRVTGLDPAGQMFSKMIRNNRLNYNSANFVDVMHTSNSMQGDGYGFHESIGSIDIYPNGGTKQPACKIGGTYHNADAEVFKIKSFMELASCYHDIALPYFMNSIQTCKYLSVECTSYKHYLQGRCNSDDNPNDRMGLHCVPIQGLPVESTFYLNTSATTPYC